MSKPILCLDFDGVIHDYLEGWKDGEIYGHVTKGFFIWLAEAQEVFDIVIYSSRSKTPEGRLDMGIWLDGQVANWRKLTGDTTIFRYRFAHEKPPAFVTIDDRCLKFDGDWSDLPVEELIAFKPWGALKQAKMRAD